MSQSEVGCREAQLHAMFRGLSSLCLVQWFSFMGWFITVSKLQLGFRLGGHHNKRNCLKGCIVRKIENHCTNGSIIFFSIWCVCMYVWSVIHTCDDVCSRMCECSCLCVWYKKKRLSGVLLSLFISFLWSQVSLNLEIWFILARPAHIVFQ